MKAAVGPELGAGDEVGIKRIALDVAAEGEEMIVALDGEGFEAALVEVAVADGVMGDAPAHGVSVGEPAEKIGELVVFFRPDDEVPVGGHEAEGEDADGVALVSEEEDAEEGVVVGGFSEHGHAVDGAVEDVVDEAAGSGAG